MTGRARVGWQVAAAAWAVLIVAMAGQATGSASRYPWWTNTMVYTATALMGAVGADRVIAWRADRSNRSRDEA
ncbi:hypothetical protein [Streptomyces sp. BRA346]|uniref:hypothetical protein n=1 Tax=Streptomyces sp. BRA346 TaxID=2878199 RepID=UPI00406285E3